MRREANTAERHIALSLLCTPLGVREGSFYGQLGPKYGQLPWRNTINDKISLLYGVWVIRSKWSVKSMAQLFWYNGAERKERWSSAEHFRWCTTLLPSYPD